MAAERTITRRRNAGGLEKYLPVVHFLLALAVIAVALPSALRPPADPANTSAEFSPDAPPGDQQDAIVAALNRGVSATAGGGDGLGGQEGEGNAIFDPNAPGKPPPLPRSSASCVGDPPRQAESPYAPPCAPTFTGDNGGATYQGVTDNEIRIGVRGTTTQGGPSGDCSRWGRVEDMEDRTTNERTWYVMQQYFNKNFQFWGRRVTFYCVDPTGWSQEEQRAAAIMADEEFKVFAVNAQYTTMCRELVRRKVVVFCEALSERLLRQYRPYAWESYLASSEHARFLGELACKALVGKPPEFAGDPQTLGKSKRKFGLIQIGSGSEEGNLGGEHARHVVAAFDEMCNEPVEVVYFSDATDSNLQAALVRMRNEGVTSIIPSMDWVSLAQLTNAASAQRYLPEWIANDSGAVNRNQLGQFQNPDAWKHSFGIAGQEPERPNEATDCWRAYRSIDPENNPDPEFCIYVWRMAILLMTGLQMAGPELTPENFERGMFDFGMRYWTDPVWPIGGGFAPGIHSYPHNVALLWYDPSAPDPRAGGTGAYRYLYDAGRFCEGQLPSTTEGFFETGITRPHSWDKFTGAPPQPTCPPPPTKA